MWGGFSFGGVLVLVGVVFSLCGAFCGSVGLLVLFLCLVCVWGVFWMKLYEFVSEDGRVLEEVFLSGKNFNNLKLHKKADYLRVKKTWLNWVLALYEMLVYGVLFVCMTLCFGFLVVVVPLANVEPVVVSTLAHSIEKLLFQSVIALTLTVVLYIIFIFYVRVKIKRQADSKKVK